jgi:hypothetical protein
MNFFENCKKLAAAKQIQTPAHAAYHASGVDVDVDVDVDIDIDVLII